MLGDLIKLRKLVNKLTSKAKLPRITFTDNYPLAAELAKKQGEK